MDKYSVRGEVSGTERSLQLSAWSGTLLPGDIDHIAADLTHCLGRDSRQLKVFVLDSYISTDQLSPGLFFGLGITMFKAER